MGKDYQLAYHLAPPSLAKKNAKGELQKQRFGPWMLSAFKVLARLKGLRGTPFDPFGRTEERRIERALIAEYRAVDRGGAARPSARPTWRWRSRSRASRRRSAATATSRRATSPPARPKWDALMADWRAGPLALSAQALEPRMAQGPDTQPLEDTTLPMTSPPRVVAAIGLSPAARGGTDAAVAGGVRPAPLHPGPRRLRPIAAPWRERGAAPTVAP